MTARRINGARTAFTLAETVLASVILCAAVVTICAITTRGLAGTKLNRQYDLAWQLLDRQLTLIDYIGIDGFIELGQMQGVFEGLEPTYRWQVETSPESYDNLYKVAITVSWQAQNQPYSITAETMLNGQGLPAIIAQ